MKAKTLLALVLLAHLLAHPAMHAFLTAPSTAADHATFSTSGNGESRGRPEGSNCYLCRSGHALPAPAASEFISHATVAEPLCGAPDAQPHNAWHSAVPARAPPVS